MTTPGAAGTQLSIVIPAYNEAERIGPALERILAFLEEEGIRAEALVVDDGSTDGTAEVVRAFAPRFATIGRLGLLDHERNRGKGYSVRQGMLAAGGEHVLFTDSDLSTPIEEYPRLAAPLRRGDAEIAIGSRALDRSRVQVRQTWIRETSGRTFNLVVRKLTGLPFQDTQCGFKLFTRRAAQAVFALQTLEGFGFDVEVLYIATKLGFRAVEIPVVWRNVEGSRVRMLSGARAFADVVRVLRQDAQGRYGGARASGSGA